MLKLIGKTLAASVVALGLGTAAANADACSGHSHTTGTVLGAVGGGLIGSQVVHGPGGVVGGAVLGGLAGNAISRDIDCHHRYYDRDRRRYYYRSRYYYRDHHRYYD